MRTNHTLYCVTYAKHNCTLKSHSVWSFTKKPQQIRRERDAVHHKVFFFALLIKSSIPYTQFSETWFMFVCIRFIVLAFFSLSLLFFAMLCFCVFLLIFLMWLVGQLISRLNMWDGSIQREIDAHNIHCISIDSYVCVNESEFWLIFLFSIYVKYF